MITQGPHNPNKAITMFSQAEIARVFFLHDGSDFDGSFTVSLTDGTAPPQTVTVDVEVSRPTDIITGFPLQVKEAKPGKHGRRFRDRSSNGAIRGILSTHSSTTPAVDLSIGSGGGNMGREPACWISKPSASHTIIVARVRTSTGFSFDKAFTIAVLRREP